MTECIFCKIARREIDTDLLYEDADFVAFRDANPQAPEHVLVIPKRHIPTLLDVDAGDHETLGRLQHIAIDLARRIGLGDRGFRLVTNCLEGGGQAVFHLHLHLLGGRTMGWPPG